MLKDVPDIVPHCTICAHEEREGIEMLGIISCGTWGICAKRINGTFGTHFTAKTVENHMCHHMLHKTSVEAGVILGGITDPDTPKVSVESMLQTMLVQGMLDLAKGKIRCKSTSDLLALVNTIQNVQNRKEQEKMLEEGDISAYYAAMAAYGDAIKDTVSPAQLGEIVVKANALGAHFDIGNVPVEKPIDIQAEKMMDVAVADYKRNGKGRSREELLESGVIDEMTKGLDLD